MTPGSTQRKKKLAILINVVAPYRVPLYEYLANHFDTLVLSGGKEGNRTWTLNAKSPLVIEEVWGFQFKSRKKIGVRNVTDRLYVHFGVGLLWRLPQYRPDIVVTNEMGFRTLIALFYGKLAGVPVWIWWGGTLHSEHYISKSRLLLRRLIVQLGKLWISYGATSTEYLLSLGIPRPDILQIQNCVMQETFLHQPASKPDWFAGERRPVLLGVGQLVKRKGFDRLIQACGRLRKRGFEFSLVLVGQGPEREQLIALARGSGIERLVILPNKDQPVLNEIYRSADIFVLPTLEDNWGLVVNEALWAGLPVLCSRYAGCSRELLPEQCIFDPLDPASFDAALLEFFEGKLAKPDQSRLMTWQRVAEMLRSALDQNSPG